MASRIIAQLIIQGTTVLTKVFISAYQQALQNAKRGGGATAAATSFRVKMREDEALKILDIEKSNLTKDYVEKQFKKFFDINDPKKGGSFYIQSKIFRAKEALLQKEERDGNPKPQS